MAVVVSKAGRCIFRNEASVVDLKKAKAGKEAWDGRYLNKLYNTSR